MILCKKLAKFRNKVAERSCDWKYKSIISTILPSFYLTLPSDSFNQGCSPRPAPPCGKTGRPAKISKSRGAKLIVDSDISAAQFHKRLNLSPDYENDDDNYDDKNNYDDADGDDDEGIHENS